MPTLTDMHTHACMHALMCVRGYNTHTHTHTHTHTCSGWNLTDLFVVLISIVVLIVEATYSLNKHDTKWLQALRATRCDEFDIVLVYHNVSMPAVMHEVPFPAPLFTSPDLLGIRTGYQDLI